MIRMARVNNIDWLISVAAVNGGSAFTASHINGRPANSSVEDINERSRASSVNQE